MLMQMGDSFRYPSGNICSQIHVSQALLRAPNIHDPTSAVWHRPSSVYMTPPNISYGEEREKGSVQERTVGQGGGQYAGGTQVQVTWTHMAITQVYSPRLYQHRTYLAGGPTVKCIAVS